MSLFTLDQLLTPTTKEEIAQNIFDYMASVGLPVTQWEALSPLRTLVFAFARVLVVIQNLVVAAIRGGFRDTADANWLPVLSKQLYDVDAIPATFASGTDCLVLDNAGGGIYHYAPQELVLKGMVNGKTYHNTNVVDVGALEVGVLVSLSADEIGAASNIAAGQVVQLVTTALGVTPTLIGNVNGQDDEAPDALRERDLDSLGSLSPNGAAGAYDYVLKTPALNGGVTVNRTRTLPPPGDGTVTIVVASPTGPVTVGDLAVLQTAVDERATPEIVTATVVSATPAALSYTTTIKVALKGAPDNATLLTTVQDALLAFVNGKAATATQNAIAPLPIGGLVGNLVPWRTVVGVIENASPDGGLTKPVLEATLGIEIDTGLATTDVATLDAGSVFVTVVRVP